MTERLRPIIITGVPRSGTSLVCGIINLSGAWGGDLIGPNAFNKKGMFENSAIRDGIVKDYLRRNGWDPMCQKPLPDRKHLGRYDFRAKILQVLENQGYKGGPWFFKSVKGCHFWPLLQKAFPEAKWVIVRRENEALVSALIRTPFMHAFGSSREAWLRWVEVHIERFDEIKGSNLESWEVWPQKIVDGEHREVHNMVEAIGLSWNAEAVVDFVERDLWHGS